MMLMTYGHGLRVSELVGLRLKDLDLETGSLYARRKKGSLSTHQPIEGDELRALRAWLREREQLRDSRSPYLERAWTDDAAGRQLSGCRNRQASEAAFSYPSAHAAAFNRILPGQSWLRHETGAGLFRTQKHRSHGQIHQKGLWR